MKIKNVFINNRKKVVMIETYKGSFSLPFSKLQIKPTKKNKIDKIFVDKELASQAITYKLSSGEEDSVHIDAFLDYNHDPNFLREAILHGLTAEALKFSKSLAISKHEIARRLFTSLSQVYRLLDPKNNKKSVDGMLRLLAVLGSIVKFRVIKRAA